MDNLDAIQEKDLAGCGSARWGVCRSLVKNVLVSALCSVALGGCISPAPPPDDALFGSLLDCAVGPLSVDENNAGDAVYQFYSGANLSLASNGIPAGISAVHAPSVDVPPPAGDGLRVTFPRSSIFDMARFVSEFCKCNLYYGNGRFVFCADIGSGDAECPLELGTLARIGPFSFDGDSLEHICSRIFGEGNLQLSESGYRGVSVVLLADSSIGDRRYSFDVGYMRPLEAYREMADKAGVKIAYDGDFVYVYRDDRSLDRLGYVHKPGPMSNGREPARRRSIQP